MLRLSSHLKLADSPRSRWLVANVRTISDVRKAGAPDPLHVLFCGSDAFSIHSLRALHALRNRAPNVIKTIDVLCRPDKRVGRGLKQIQSVPIKSVAQELGLQLHQVDSFKQWGVPSPFPDLIVTASFGLLVPSSILSQAKYGGLNVHPSLLPNLRGAAPIQHALLRRMESTGVTLQTMHHTKFDHGTVLAQREIRISETTKGEEEGRLPNVTDLIDRLGAIGGEVLVNGIENGSFTSPGSVNSELNDDSRPMYKAPKITAEDRKIQWEQWSAKDVVLRDHVLGRLWDTSTAERYLGSEEDLGKRIAFTGPWRIVTDQIEESLTRPGNSLAILDHSTRGANSQQVAIKAIDGHWVSPSAATIDGQGKDKGVPYLCRRLQARLPA